MIAYLDTSALVKLYVDENGSGLVHDMVDASLIVATSKVAFAEARSAFFRVFKEGFLDEGAYLQIVSIFLADWDHYLCIEVSGEVIRLAGELVEKYQLRGFDAIHLSAAHILKQQVKAPVVAACWDARLWEAFQKSGFTVIPAEKPGSG
ncbi:type II toxin-antitoxin system VapC family toxin [Desulfotomaculum copahuensis]|uniref:Twitching motility protein PilT n=1 Tax=Desulfotomaculum copahuensis TaxID=1838280 RepID=A0A1B7LGI4_9FIRM|nr:type II toxin-antitoxin system VapC family toxin [Desulfotomaculum copahuensis]OAT85217.1 twitching motility protein PilT [Desulfotomaculum copahuensis]